MADIVERSEALDRRILAIPEDQVFTKRAVFFGFVVLAGLLLAVLGGIISIQIDTKQAVERQVAPLQARVAELEEIIVDLEDVNVQATDAIVLLITTLQQNSIEPPQIIIRPSEDP